MTKPTHIKSKIINSTIKLILSSNGNTNSITMRDIAKEANVGTGLINYHFQTKANLIEISIQTFILKIITDYHPNIDSAFSGKENLRISAKEVMDFLMSYPSISTISIIGDYTNPKSNDNTMNTVNGFYNIYNEKEANYQNSKALLFGLTSIIQSIFLKREISLECLGFDVNNKLERDQLLDIYIDQMF